MKIEVKKISELNREDVAGHHGFESRLFAEVIGKKVTVRLLNISPDGVGPTPAHKHDDVHFFLVLEGTLSLRIEKETYKIKKGECIEVPAGDVHQLQNHENDKIQVLAVKWG
jgi:quercetin dioxygenase-like cupin family protein